jgi:hypothetical protein
MGDLTFSFMPAYMNDITTFEGVWIPKERYEELLLCEEALSKIEPTVEVEDLGDDE